MPFRSFPPLARTWLTLAGQVHAAQARVCTTGIPPRIAMPKAERRPQDGPNSRRIRSTSSPQGNKVVPPQRSRMHAVDAPPSSGFFLTAPLLDYAPGLVVEVAMDEGPPPAPRWRPSSSSSLQRPSSSSLLPKPDPQLVAAAEVASETAGAFAATASASLDDLLLGRISISEAAAASAAAAAAADKAWAANEAARGSVRLPPAAAALAPGAQPQVRRAALEPGRPRQREVSGHAAKAAAKAQDRRRVAEH